jgi:hypothetical protein
MAQSVNSNLSGNTNIWKEGRNIAISSMNVHLVGMPSSLDAEELAMVRTAMMLAFNEAYQDSGMNMKKIEIVKQRCHPQKQKFLRTKLGSLSRGYVTLCPQFEINDVNSRSVFNVDTFKRARMQRRWENGMCDRLKRKKEFSNKLDICLVTRNRMDDLHVMEN